MICYMNKIELKKALFLFIKINKRKPNISIFVLFGATGGRRKEQTKFVTEQRAQRILIPIKKVLQHFKVQRVWRASHHFELSLKVKSKVASGNGTINIHPKIGWFFIFGYNPSFTGYAQVRLFLDLPVLHILLTTHKWVAWVKYT